MSQGGYISGLQGSYNSTSPVRKGAGIVMYRDLGNVHDIKNNDPKEKILFHALVRMSVCRDSNQIDMLVGGDETEVQYIIPEESELTDELLRSTVTWSYAFNGTHSQFLRDHSERFIDTWVLCIGYSNDSGYDIQLGLTGGCKTGESEEDCIRREAMEECNIEGLDESECKLGWYNRKRNMQWKLEAFLI